MKKKACRLRAYSYVWSARVVMSVCIVKGRHFVGLIQGVFHGKINKEVVYPDLAHGVSGICFHAACFMKEWKYIILGAVKVLLAAMTIRLVLQCWSQV